MKNRVLVLLLVLVLTLASVGIASAQGGGDLKAVTTDTVNSTLNQARLRAVAELSAYSVVAVTGTDQSGAWLQVSAAEGDGYIMADAATVLDLPLLAPKAMVATSSAGATALYPEPSFAADLLASLPDGTVASVWAPRASGLMSRPLPDGLVDRLRLGRTARRFDAGDGRAGSDRCAGDLQRGRRRFGPRRSRS